MTKAKDAIVVDKYGYTHSVLQLSTQLLQTFNDSTEGRIPTPEEYEEMAESFELLGRAIVGEDDDAKHWRLQCAETANFFRDMQKTSLPMLKY